MSALQYQFGPQLFLIALIVIASAAVALAVSRQGTWPFGLAPAATSLAVGSTLAIVVATVTPRANARAIGKLQLVPFQTLRTYRYHSWDLLVYLGGNVALFVPLGFFTYLALRRWVIAATAVCALVSVAVEVMQIPIWSRSTDVDDVLTNTFGGLVGAMAGLLVLSVIGARRSPGGSGPPAPAARHAVGSRAS